MQEEVLMQDDARQKLTLVEVLVVAILIVLVVSLFWPATGGHDPSYRTVCLANLRVIGQGCITYAIDNNGRFPCAGAVREPAGENGAGFTLIGRGWNWDGIREHVHDPGTNLRSNTRHLWLLVRLRDADPKTFVCPEDPDAGEPFVRTDMQAAYDFQDRSQVSYSFQYQGAALTRQGEAREGWNTNVKDDPKLVILADRTPMLRAKDGSASDPTVGCQLEIARADNFGKRFVRTLRDQLSDIRWDRAQAEAVYTSPAGRGMRALNSPNHKGEGQNVLRLDGSGDFAGDPWCGAYRDNIWTVQDPDVYGKPKGKDDDSRALEGRMRGIIDVTEPDMLKAWQADSQSRTRYPDSFLVP
jgi:hypothetical protein